MVCPFKVVFIVFLCIIGSESFEFFSSSAVIGGLSASFTGFKYLYEPVKSYFSESCNENWIINDFTGLERDFETKLHGQHLVSKIVLRSLRQHAKNENPRKALVLSFHGRTGSGKNHVANLTAYRIFKKGSDSSFYKLWVAKSHFPHERYVSDYMDTVQGTVRDMVSACPRSLFVFDEADLMPPGLIDALKPFLDHHENIDGVDYRKATFIFLSNTGSDSIAEVAFECWKENRKRESLTMKEIEPLVFRQSFNEKGGLHKTSLTKNSLIDFYVPFLPLEKKHVIMCVKDLISERGCRKNIDQLIENVADSVEYEPPDFYSKTGCKAVESRFNIFADDYDCYNAKN